MNVWLMASFALLILSPSPVFASQLGDAGGDPEEFLKLYIEDKEAKRECIERVAQWVKN